MSNSKSNEFLKVKPSKIILIFSLSFLFLETLFFFTFQSQFTSLDVSFYIYTPFLVIFGVIFCILSITRIGYTIDDEKLCHYKFKKADVYSWKAIIYIDEEYSLKHKTLTFVTHDGLVHYLMFDKDGKIYKKALEKVNQISKQELFGRFPNVKL